MPVDLDGARILITGGSSGLGLDCAERLADSGARLALLARGEDGLARAAATLASPPRTFAADVRDLDALQAAVAAAADALGGLDVVVASAGIAAIGPFVDMPEEAYRGVIETTLIGALNTAHATLPALERSGGVLVILGSVSGRIPTPWLAAYAAAKHGVRGFVRSLDCELRAAGSRVRVVVVEPGPVDTPIWRRSRTTDGRLPPDLPGVYRPGAVTEEVLRAIAHPGGAERSVGGLVALSAIADSLLPNLSVRALGTVAGLAWRRRERRPRQTEDSLEDPIRVPHREAGMRSRPSLLAAMRRLRS